MSQRWNISWKPRLSMKKLLLFFLIAASGLLLAMHNQWKSSPTADSRMGLEPSGKLIRIINNLNNQTIMIREGLRGAPLKMRVIDIPFSTPRPVQISSTPRRRLPMSLSRSSALDPNYLQIPADSERPWYMKGGQLYPKNSVINTTSGMRSVKIFPNELPGEDRIPDQLMYLPPVGTLPDNQEDPNVPLKKILLWNGASSWGGLKPGRGIFLKEKCPVSTCVLSSSRGEAESADLVLFKDHFTMPYFKRPLNQIWMLYLLECPLHTQIFKQANIFNWTATYRTDSTIVAPYERWQYYNENVKTMKQEVNYAANKTKQVAWFVSNCGARNGRLNYARELGKYINVDIYGACGSKRCPRSSANKCFTILDKDYKFYLAFENSNCKDYITEKFFVNGLGHDILPIAMGARLEDYEQVSPYKSFLHVDQFAGPRELAKYLLKLDKDDEAYNQYFKWKGTGEFINTKFWCRICGLMHENKDHSRSTGGSFYQNINEWWRGDSICANKGWKEGSGGQGKLSKVSNSSTTKASRSSVLMA